MHSAWRNFLLGALTLGAAHAVSNVDPNHAASSSSFIGAIDWRPSAEQGASINQYFCSGFLHGELVGWIQLGDGAPADGLRYRNTAAADFGVNVLPSGALRGFAYGANIGWINFEDQGNPRVDWVTGKLLGSIYSANTGWMPLDGLENSIQLIEIGASADADADGLPDAWEISRAGALTALTASRDSDGDGLTDHDEFLAGTDPLNPAEKLGPIRLSADKVIQWPTQNGHLYLLERRASLNPSSPWESVHPAPIMGTGQEASFNLSASLSGPGFFRVRAFPPLTQFN